MKPLLKAFFETKPRRANAQKCTGPPAHTSSAVPASWPGAFLSPHRSPSELHLFVVGALRQTGRAFSRRKHATRSTRRVPFTCIFWIQLRARVLIGGGVTLGGLFFWLILFCRSAIAIYGVVGEETKVNIIVSVYLFKLLEFVIFSFFQFMYIFWTIYLSFS